MAISSVYDATKFQIIQSSTNRQRIDEQYQNTDENTSQSGYQSTVDTSKVPTDVVPKVGKAEYEAQYAQAQEEFSSQKNTSTKISAYQSVQNQDKRESMSQMLGVSVYA